MVMFFTKRVRELEQENAILQKQLQAIKSQMPQILELSQLIHDLNTSGAGLLAIKRLATDDVYLWGNDA